MTKRMTFERSYEAPVEALWELWTTKEGFESWWGPEGCHVEVHELDLRVGGALFYDMIVENAPEHSHATRGRFAEIVPLQRLKIRHLIDFVAGVEPYEHDLVVELFPEGKSVRMVITVEPHYSEELTRMSAEGLTSQLRKIPAALDQRSALRSTQRSIVSPAT